MTSNELQRLAQILSNQSWCRHWLNFHNVELGEQMVMAIQVRDEWGRPQRVHDLEKKGFEIEGEFIYTIERTDPTGCPYLRQLP